MAVDTSQLTPPVPPAGGPTPEEFARLTDEANRLRARVEFPLASSDILDLISGTPEQIRGAAEKLHTQAAAAAAAAAPAPAPAALQPTPGPAPVPGPGQAQPPDHAADARRSELQYKVETRTAEPHERQEFFTTVLRDGWNEQVGRMAARNAR